VTNTNILFLADIQYGLQRYNIILMYFFIDCPGGDMAEWCKTASIDSCNDPAVAATCCQKCNIS